MQCFGHMGKDLVKPVWLYANKSAINTGSKNTSNISVNSQGEGILRSIGI